MVEKQAVPFELWMLLSQGGRECMKCKRRFFGNGVVSKVCRRFYERDWMFEVVCCGKHCFGALGY